MPVPNRKSVQHYRGDAFAMLLRLWEDTAKTDPADLSAAIVTAQLRLTVDTSTVVASFEVSVEDNAIHLVLAPAITATMPPKSVFDVQVDWVGDGTSIQTVLAGDFTLAPDVTRTG
jgi:hypothetical protein